MKITELKNLLNEFGENVRFEHDLKKKNWFNIGGKSKVFFKAENLNLNLKIKKKPTKFSTTPTFSLLKRWPYKY